MFNSFSGAFQFGRRPISVVSVASPTAIANNVIWYNADLGNNTNFNNTLTTGSRANQWADRSGASHNANASGGARPTWISPVQNNLGALQFNGTTTTMTVNPIVWMQSLSAYTMFIVARASALTGTTYISGTDTGGFAVFHNGTNYAVSTSGGTGTSTLIGDLTNFHLFCLRFDGTATGNDNRLKFRYDGSEQTLSWTGTVGTTTNAAAKYWNLAASSSTTNVAGNQQFWNGYIAEVTMYTRALSLSEIQGVEQYFRSHWAI